MNASLGGQSLDVSGCDFYHADQCGGTSVLKAAITIKTDCMNFNEMHFHFYHSAKKYSLGMIPMALLCT